MALKAYIWTFIIFTLIDSLIHLKKLLIAYLLKQLSDFEALKSIIVMGKLNKKKPDQCNSLIITLTEVNSKAQRRMQEGQSFTIYPSQNGKFLL